ncbi:MAG: MBOAT family protein, partial [Planctomycetes bacterium]|nr:MBOAT family protein [Planctomycetota bacterium]
MLFNSVHFLIFFPLAVAAYYLLPFRHRCKFLLAASYYFYMCWKPAYILLIIVSTLVDYVAAHAMDRHNERNGRRKWLIVSLIANLGLLFSFKYYNFFAATWNDLFPSLGTGAHLPALDVLLPVGISFYTFQTLSYTIEVYRGTQKPEKRLMIFALYVAFFPQLVAGPIERPGNLLSQFDRKNVFQYDRVLSGLRQMLWGFFKKMVIADNLAVIVNQVYGAPADYAGPALTLATVFFAFQIFCDFSGYSDIAIGASRVLGYDLMTNFRRPYFAKSIQDFWARWHISLSTWFRDYLYISLGGNRVSKGRWYFNLAVVFLVSGLWHGANWTFVVWGALHGTYLITAILTQKMRARTAALVRIERTPFLHKLFNTGWCFVLVCFSWIFFRADSMGDAWRVVTHLGSGWGG